MMLQSRSTVPLHLGIVFTATIQTGKGYVEVVMENMITGHCFLSKLKDT